MKEFSRLERISKEMKRNLSKIINDKLNDPRIKLVTISDIKVSPDLKLTKIFVTFMYNKNILEIKKKIKILQKASNFISKSLINSMILRDKTKLIFIHDKTSIEANKINLLMKI